MISPDVKLYGLGPWGLMYIPVPFVILATIAISLRSWVRISFARAFGLDDYLLVGAYGLYLVQSAATIAIGVVQYTHGVTTTMELLGVLSFAEIISYDLGQILFKLSLAVLFMRIVTEPWPRLVIIGSVTLFALYSIGALLLIIFQCGDPSTIDLESGANCLPFDTSVGPVLYVLASFNAVIDWIFALLPITVIRKLHMKTEDKRSVIFMILLACSCSAVSIVRIPFMKDLRLTDSFYAGSQNAISYLSVIESGFGIIVASAATYRPLLRMYKAKLRRFIASRRSSSREVHGGGGGGAGAGAEHSMVDLAEGKTLEIEGLSYGPISSSAYAKSWDVTNVPEHMGWKRDGIIPDIDDWDEGEGENTAVPMRRRSVLVVDDGTQKV